MECVDYVSFYHSLTDNQMNAISPIWVLIYVAVCPGTLRDMALITFQKTLLISVSAQSHEEKDNSDTEDVCMEDCLRLFESVF